MLIVLYDLSRDADKLVSTSGEYSSRGGLSMAFVMTMGQLDPGMMLSTNFSLAKLTKTSTGLPNLPNEGSLELRNLGWTADMLEQLGYDVGPFKVVSGFRTHDVQIALADRGEPVASGKSFHEAGLAVDIFPTTMGIEEFYGKLAALVGTSDNQGPWWGKLSEIAIKPGQNSIHLALAVPGSKQNVFLALNSVGIYAALTTDEVLSYAQPFIAAVEEIASRATATMPRKLILLTAVGGGLLFVLYMMTKKQRTT